jgi:hypothetical protein
MDTSFSIAAPGRSAAAAVEGQAVAVEYRWAENR